MRNQSISPHPWRLVAGLAVLALITAGCSKTVTIESTTTQQAPTAAVAPTSEVEPTEAPAATPVPVATTAAEPAATATPEPAVETPEPTVAPSSGGVTTVVLIDSGSEPRTELRLDVAIECSQLIEMTQTQEITQMLNGTPAPTGPAVTSIAEMRIIARAVGDNYEVTSTIEGVRAGPDTDPTFAPILEAELQAIVGLSTTVLTDDRGVALAEPTITGTEGLGPLRELVEGLGSQVQNPFPVEPVGPGALWTVSNPIEVQGLTVNNITTYRLVSIDGSRVQLEVSGGQEVGPNEVFTFDGFSADVLEWSVDASGTTVLDLHAPGPIEADISGTGLQVFDFGAGAAGGTLEQEIATEVSMVTAESPNCIGPLTKG